MTTEERKKAFAADLLALLKKHGVCEIGRSTWCENCDAELTKDNIYFEIIMSYSGEAKSPSFSVDLYDLIPEWADHFYGCHDNRKHEPKYLPEHLRVKS